MTAFFATACGLVVANLYYSQPIAGPIGASLGLSPSATGLIVTATQVGFGTGLLLVVPLGDLVENRRLVLILTGLTAVALLGAALSTSPSLLLALHNGLLMLLLCAHASNADLFPKDKPPLDCYNFLHDWNDRGVALLTNWRHDFNGPADRNPFDLDPNVGQLLVNQLLTRPRNQSDPDVRLFNFSSGDRDLFDMKRNAQIFWLPLLIGHALPF
jgi:hypothetical protein